MRQSRRMKIATLVVMAVLFHFGSIILADEAKNVTVEDVARAELLMGLSFTAEERDSMLDELEEHLRGYKALRERVIDNSVVPALVFNPLPPGFEPKTRQKSLKLSRASHVDLPERFDDLAFYSVRDLGELLRARKVTSLELTQLAIRRLKQFDSLLLCVTSLTEELALERAAKADSEIAVGRYRGPLHGIPYGAKDLLAVRTYKTTWGATPFKDQIIDEDAAVIKKLDKAGAVLVAKLTLGALAWGDVWFGGQTRNPWNLEQGSSGSSAGPASAVAAGLVPFAIGSETWGSIVSPSTRCGTTGLRPTFGRVSRAGAMALSWSMDKLGPICRTVEDCALVFDGIRGSDGNDPSVIDGAFNYSYNVNLSRLKLGYLKSDFDNDTANTWHNDAVLEKLRELGAELIPITLPPMSQDGMAIILVAEAAAAFDELTRSNRDDLLVRQIKNAWPNVLRASRFIPAVEYLQANRTRTMLIQEMSQLMSGIDVYVAPTFEGNNLLMTNLTGHPCVVLPDGFSEDGTPTSITFMGKLFDEATLLAVARKYQVATEFHARHPEQFK